MGWGVLHAFVGYMLGFVKQLLMHQIRLFKRFGRPHSGSLPFRNQINGPKCIKVAKLAILMVFAAFRKPPWEDRSSISRHVEKTSKRCV